MADFGAVLQGLSRGALAERQRRRESEEATQSDIAMVVAEELARAKAKRQHPSAEERINSIIADLVGEFVRKEPTPEEAESSIPPIVQPGPGGGFVGGKGKIELGRPMRQAPKNVLNQMGQALAEPKVGARQQRAQEMLEFLGKMGTGTLSTRSGSRTQSDPIVNVGTDEETGERVAITQSGRVVPIPE